MLTELFSSSVVRRPTPENHLSFSGRYTASTRNVEATEAWCLQTQCSLTRSFKYPLQERSCSDWKLPASRWRLWVRKLGGVGRTFFRGCTLKLSESYPENRGWELPTRKSSQDSTVLEALEQNKIYLHMEGSASQETSGISRPWNFSQWLSFVAGLRIRQYLKT